MRQQYQDRIVIDPRLMAGKPVLRGTRIPVELVVRMVAQGIPTDEILADYPNLEATDIQAALGYANAPLNQREDFYDTLLAQSRADEPRETLEEVRQRLAGMRE